ncbi:MAG: spermidine synthase, partial [Methylococcaceae bacterium]|nr:spermidine synthase [Methylococcaceae bacterium]
MSNDSKTNRHFSTIILFAGTLFVSASLMFVLQPLFGKILLPLLGGSPAVWNTCMVFYQSILFLGYLYAHALSTRYQNRPQILIHLAVILISLLALPVALPENTIPPTNSNPTFWLCWTLFLAIGLPFFILSTTAPLIQKWFSKIGHPSSDDPYFLYAASNTGSLIALLSYPFLLEPSIGLANQQTDWSIGYGLLCLLIAACGLLLWKSQQSNNTLEINTPIVNGLPWSTKLHWLALALVPSSLLLGLTNFISTDI